MTRDVLPGSRWKSYEEQCALVSDHANCTGLSYEVPGALEAAVVMLLHHVRSGERLYSDNPYTYTRCREKAINGNPVVVGGFSSGGPLRLPAASMSTATTAALLASGSSRPLAIGSLVGEAPLDIGPLGIGLWGCVESLQKSRKSFYKLAIRAPGGYFLTEKMAFLHSPRDFVLIMS